jgi:hypothetical protein
LNNPNAIDGLVSPCACLLPLEITKKRSHQPIPADMSVNASLLQVKL